MSYTLRFSDLTKDNTVTVPDMPPGINTVDTSLNLVGRGYPNYGEKIAENFLHLLENFSGPIPPENPIEGQLWYDTSDTSKKVLRIMDGTATATRWPSANGIYQQNTDPKNTATPSLKDGDIWVDTSLNQLRIYKNGSWSTVGPTIASGGTRSGTEIVERTNILGQTSTIILNYLNDVVVSVISNTATILNPAIDGFGAGIGPGINLRSADALTEYRIWGDADRALNLKIDGVVRPGNEFLRKNDYSNRGQVINGHVVFTQSNAGLRDANSLNNGLVIDSGVSNEYIQFVKHNNDSVLYNSVLTGKIVLRTNNEGNAFDVVSVGNLLVEINTTATFSKNIIVAGAISVSDTSTTSIQTAGGAIISKDVTVSGSATVNGIVSANTLTLGTLTGSGVAIAIGRNGTYDIGTASNQFRNLFVTNVYSTATIHSPVVTADSVSALAMTANGSAVNITGEIKLHTGSTAPAGWVFCNGASYSVITYSALFAVTGYNYGGSGVNFNVPNLTNLSATTGTVKYIIKT
jgi:hypothetical protein